MKVKTQIDGNKWKEGLTWFDGLGRTIRTQAVDDDGDVFVLTCYDSMGRVSKASNPFRNRTTEDCSTANGTSDVFWTTNTFDAAGRPWKVTTPDGAVVETTYSLASTTGFLLGTVVTVEDQADKQRRSISNALGQLVRVDEPDTSSPTGSLGSVTSPNQPTAYGYDLLNNLITVSQTGTGIAQCGPTWTSEPCPQTRSFSYDALSRLKQATNPESGTIKYTYDANSNLKTKWDARGIKTIYDYDALNRVWKRCYKSVGTTSLGFTTCADASGETAESKTPDVLYYYDNVTNAKGKLTKVTNGTGADRSTTEYLSFDILGRVTRSKQTTDGVEYGGGTDANAWMTYGYNLSGALVEQQYPSGRKVENTLDASGDLEMVKSRKNAGSGYWAYANNFTYNAAGAVTSMQLGNGTWESTTFNSRLQPEQIALGTAQNGYDKLKLNYTYGVLENGTLNTLKNNGNLQSQTITVPGTNGFTAVQSYTYDSLNRLKTANEKPQGWTDCTSDPTKCWSQEFGYDRFGNRNFVEAPTTTLPKNCGTSVCAADKKVVNPAIDFSNNRLSTSDGYTFDNAGNTTKDAKLHKFTYDGENKQVKVETVNAQDQVTGTVGEYWYDGDGKRVKKYVPYVDEEHPGEVTVFVYDAMGKLIAEYSTIVEPIETAKIAYLTNDHLGSPRVNTDKNGNVTARHDYHPFGEEIATSQRTTGLGYAGDTVRKQFTGYERDGETDLDFAQARYLNAGLGRFSSPDSFANDTHATNPQSWNLYNYVRNNPLSFIDPTGKGGQIYYSYDEKTNTTTIKIVASFSVYGAKGQNVSKKDREAYAKMLKDGLEGHFNQTFTNSDGRKFVMSADISVSVKRTEAGAIGSGADNIVELGYSGITSSSGEDSQAVGFGVSNENYDRMAVSITSGVQPGGSTAEFLGIANTFAHEFGAHLLHGKHNEGNSESLFHSPSGATFFQSDFERLFREFRDPKPPPFRNIPVPDPAPFSDVLKSIGQGGERRRAEFIVGGKDEAFKWVQRTKQ